jgi:hypothetical protein
MGLKTSENELPISIQEILGGVPCNHTAARAEKVAAARADPVMAAKIARVRKLLIILARLSLLADARRYHAGKEAG